MQYTASQIIGSAMADLKRQLAGGGLPIVSPEPGAAPIPNVLVVNTFGPLKTNETKVFDAGTVTPAVKYVHTGASENAILLFADPAERSYVTIDLGNRYFTPRIYVDGALIQTLNPYDYGKAYSAGDVLDIATSATRLVTLTVNGETVRTWQMPASVTDRLDGTDGRYIIFKYSQYVQAQNAATITLSGGVIAPTVLKASDLDAQGFAVWDIEYIGAPRGYMFRVDDQLGNQIKAYEPVEVVTNPTAGKCQLRAKTQVGTLGVGYNYTLVEFDGSQQPTGQTFKMRRTRLKKGLIGSNVAGMQSYYRLSRVYTNMFRQAEIRGTGFSFPSIKNNPELLNERGEPRQKNTIQYLVQGPDTGGVHTLEFSTVSGSIPKIRVVSLTDNHSGIGAPVYEGRIARVPIVVDTDRMLASGGNTALRIIIEDFDEANPPVGYHICEQGEDKTKTFHKKWIDRQRMLRGPVRSMDAVQANEPYRYDNDNNFDTERARRNILGTQNHVVPLEDLVEMSVITGRPLWFNVSHGLLYSENGMDYLTRAMKLIFNGEGGDLGYGVSLLLRHKVEIANENWNSRLGNWGYLAAKARVNGRAGPAVNDNDAANIERVYQYIRAMRHIMAAIPDWADRLDRVFGVQMEQGDLFSNLLYTAGFDDALTLIDQFAIAPYLPGDPVAGYAPGQQPTSHSPEDVVAWLRSYLPAKMAELSAFVQKCLNTFGIPVVLYEWNIAYSTLDNRTKQEERAIKRSQVMYNFMRYEYIPPVAAIGDNAMYSDDGAPGEGNGDGSQSWSFFEGPFEGAGNLPWDAVIDFANENGYSLAA